MDRPESIGIGLAHADEFQSRHAVLRSPDALGFPGSVDAPRSPASLALPPPADARAADAFRPRSSRRPILPPPDPPAAGYFSCSINPFTNRRCMKTTTSTGGSIASIEVAMISCHTGSESGTATMR